GDRRLRAGGGDRGVGHGLRSRARRLRLAGNGRQRGHRARAHRRRPAAHATPPAHHGRAGRAFAAGAPVSGETRPVVPTVNGAEPRFDELIHAPTRLSIVALLATADWADFTFIRDTLGLSDSALSKQLSALEEAGYVE